jgi:hypothetical protein
VELLRDGGRAAHRGAPRPRGFFGEMGALASRPRNVRAVAASTRACWSDPTTFEGMCLSGPNRARA